MFLFKLGQCIFCLSEGFFDLFKLFCPVSSHLSEVTFSVRDLTSENTWSLRNDWQSVIAAAEGRCWCALHFDFPSNFIKEWDQNSNSKLLYVKLLTWAFAYKSLASTLDLSIESPHGWVPLYRQLLLFLVRAILLLSQQWMSKFDFHFATLWLSFLIHEVYDPAHLHYHSSETSLYCSSKCSWVCRWSKASTSKVWQLRILDQLHRHYLTASCSIGHSRRPWQLLFSMILSIKVNYASTWQAQWSSYL